MMDLQEMKLFSLVELCKETENYQRLFKVGLDLISNLSIELCLNLGLLKNDIMESQNIYRRFDLMSTVYKTKFGIEIFDTQKISRLREIERLYEKESKKVPHKYVMELFEIYFYLKELKIPSLKGNTDLSHSPFANSLNLFQGLSDEEQSSQDLISMFAGSKIDMKIRSLTETLKHGFNKDDFTELIRLTILKKSLQQKSKEGKVEIKGTLEDSVYSTSLFTHQIEYFFLSIIIIILGVGFLMVAEFILYPFLFEAMALLLLVPFGVGFVMLGAYYKFFLEDRLTS